MNHRPNEFTILIGERDNDGRVSDSICTMMWRFVLSVVVICMMIWQGAQSMTAANYWFHTNETTFNLSHIDQTLIASAFTTAAFLWFYFTCKYILVISEYVNSII